MNPDKEKLLSICVKISPSVKEEFFKLCNLENKFSTQVITPSFVIRDSIGKYIDKIKKKQKQKDDL